MNQRYLTALLSLTLGCTSAWLRAAPPSTPPADLTPAAVLSTMERVADWQLANPSTHLPTDWTQGAGYTGMMALASTSSSPRFLEAMMKMAGTNEWKLGPRPYHADDHCVGQTYAELFFRSKDPAMIAPMRERFDWILAHPSGDNLDFDA